MTSIAQDSMKTKRAALSKRLILDTSAVLFNEKGYDRTSLDDIAKELSVTKPSLYYYFSNKEDILLECLDVAYEHFSDGMALRDDLKKNGRDRVVIMLRLYLEIMAHEVGVSLVIADDRVMSKDGRGRYNRLRRVLNAELQTRIEQGVSDGSLKVGNVRLTTFAIFGMFNWVGHWHFRRKSIRLDQIFDNFIGVVLHGIEG